MVRFYKIILRQFCYVLLSLSNRKIAFYVPISLLVTDDDALHVIHILFFDLLLGLYYFTDIVL